MTLTERTSAVLAKLRARNDSRIRTLSRNQDCGCVVCTCEDTERCNGCGAKNCGTHPVGQIPSPKFEKEPEDAMTEALIVAIEGHFTGTGSLWPYEVNKFCEDALDSILTTLEESL